MSPATWPLPPETERVRLVPRRRELTVARAGRVTPRMHRVALRGDDLADFESPAFDDHVKVFVAADGGEPHARDYTPRRFDAATGELLLDFAVHEDGPVTRWALSAAAGDRLSVGGPRGSKPIAGVRSWLLIGDETALPAVGRKIEESGPDDSLVCVAGIADAAAEQRFDSDANLDARWVHRPPERAADPEPLLDAVRALDVPPGTFVWIAAEAGVARALRRHFLDEREHPPGWLKAAGYWVRGEAAGSERFDDPPRGYVP